MSFENKLSKVKGLGSAKKGIEHWWLQRITAIALIPILMWFSFNMINILEGDKAELTIWLKSFFNSGILIVFILVSFYHMKLGLTVVIEDYVPSKWSKYFFLAILTIISYVMPILVIISIMNMTIRIK